MLAPSLRLRGRAVRWARRRPVRSLSATIDTFAFGSVHPRCSGATTIEPPALSAVVVARATDREVEAVAEQQLAQACRGAGAVGGDDHAEAATDQLGQAVGEPGAVAGDRTPARRLDERRVGRLGRRVDRPERAGLRRAACRGRRGGAGTAVGIAGPRRRQRAGEVVLLGDQVDRPVAHPPRFDEHELGRRPGARR